MTKQSVHSWQMWPFGPVWVTLGVSATTGEEAMPSNFLCSWTLDPAPALFYVYHVLSSCEPESHYFAYRVSRVSVWGKFKFCAILKKRTVDYWSLLKSWMVCGCTGPTFPRYLSGWSLMEATLLLLTSLCGAEPEVTVSILPIIFMPFV